MWRSHQLFARVEKLGDGGLSVNVVRPYYLNLSPTTVELNFGWILRVIKNNYDLI